VRRSPPRAPTTSTTTRRVTLSVCLALLLAGGSAPAALAAQAGSPGSKPDTTHTEPSPLFTLRDAAVAAGFAGATVALFPVDERLAKRLQNPNTQENRFFKDASNGFEIIASPGAIVIGSSLYLVGRLGHYPRVADLGWHGTEAVLIATGVSGVLKGAIGRARPFVSADTNARDFKFGSGFRDDTRRSFPSGHATTAFAAAAAITSEARRWWPERWWSTWLVGPAMYGGATMVGLSRIYHNDHWGSDVALGAAIGTFSGLKVVQYSHSHPHNRVDRILLRTSLAPDGRGGAILGWSVAAP
jgi:membrane-associated phospholipid phosphatase